MTPKYAHTRKVAPWQSMEEHIAEVARRAAGFASAFDSEAWGELAGFWHDLGKYADDFQAYLRASAGDPEVADASVVDGWKSGRVDHSTAGAVLVQERSGANFPRMAGAVALAMVIAGHHSGLPAKNDFEVRRLKPEDKRARLAAARQGGAPTELLGRELPTLPSFLRPEALASLKDKDQKIRRYEFWTRMLFSTLIDADRLDTERVMNEEQAGHRVRSQGGRDALQELLPRLNLHLATKTRNSHAQLAALPEGARDRSRAMLDLRAAVLQACRSRADTPGGRFSLTVPTGGGKTLSALAFALQHAIRNDLRRVIVVIPFTSIIEQTADVYRQALGGGAVVEHHSNLDPKRESVHNRFASENWDAPIIVTTSVQFFESLYSDRGTSVRKLHNIARSVVIFDEVQSLPHDLRSPIFDAINELVDHYGVSTLLCTATQPALGKSQDGPRDFPSLKDVAEVIPDVPSLFAAVKDRVVATFPPKGAPAISWQDLAAAVAGHSRVLVIVHRRADARDLCRLLRDDTFHLSALMCPAHRRAVLATITTRLKENGPCRVVSTTLVEAGVDLDFPVVYRALGGVDSMAQAAGRCNREGRLCDADGRPIPGNLILFHSPSDPPQGLREGLSTTTTLLALDQPLDLFDPETFERYFELYLSLVKPDSKNVMRARADRDFPAVAQLFRMIDEEGQVAVVVPYGDSEKRLESYRFHAGTETLRALQPYLVKVSTTQFKFLNNEGMIEPINDQLNRLIPNAPEQYDPRFGLIVDRKVPYKPEDLVEKS